jgi:two-component system, LuxR family, sensor kinase FixL
MMAANRWDGSTSVIDGEDDCMLAIEAAGIGTWHWEIAANAIHLSFRSRELLGASRESMAYSEFLSLIHPDDRDLVAQAFRHSRTSGGEYDIDFRALATAGDGRWLCMRGRPRNLGAHGAEVRGVLLDMMQRKTAEEANSRLAAIVASSNDAIVGKTLDGVVTDWNQGAETILGYSADDIIGKSISLTLPPGHEEETAAILERIKRGERVEHFETRRRRKDGEIIDVSVTVSPVWDSSGRLLGASKVLRDITERQQTRQRLHDLQAELIHISRFTALGEMASMLAHELNQPLTAVANYLNGGRRLLEGGQTGSIPMVRDALERAAEQALRAGQIIRRLGEFVSRGESERRVENLVKLIEEASALALVGAKEAGVRMSFDFDTRVVFVLADKIQIQQVLHNLMRNAVEAMQKTSPRELTVSTRQLDHETVGVDVSDTGSGIAPEIADQLFQPFVTTKRQGMGVGLSISRTIVESHGGRLWAEPNTGGGTVFRLTLKTIEGKDIADGD